MDFAFDDSSTGVYLHRVHLTDAATGKVFYEKLGYIFIEISRFNKGIKDLKTDLDRWLYVLKNMSKLKKIPVFLTKRVFQKLFNIAEVSRLTKEEYMRYTKSMMAKWDEYAVLKTAKEDGVAEGIEKGLKKGIAKVRKKVEKKSYEVVKNLIEKMGLSDTQVADIAGVPLSFVKKVRRGLTK